MERYDITVEAEYFVIVGDDEDWDWEEIGTYTVEAENKEEAKAKAIELAILDDPHHGSEYRYVARIGDEYIQRLYESRRKSVRKSNGWIRDTDIYDHPFWTLDDPNLDSWFAVYFIGTNCYLAEITDENTDVVGRQEFPNLNEAKEWLLSEYNKGIYKSVKSEPRKFKSLLKEQRNKRGKQLW